MTTFLRIALGLCYLGYVQWLVSMVDAAIARPTDDGFVVVAFLILAVVPPALVLAAVVVARRCVRRVWEV